MHLGNKNFGCYLRIDSVIYYMTESIHAQFTMELTAEINIRGHHIFNLYSVQASTRKELGNLMICSGNGHMEPFILLDGEPLLA